MKKENLIKKLKSIGTNLDNNSSQNNNSFQLDTKSELGIKTIDVRFQYNEVLFYAYNNYDNNYDSPIIFNTLNKVLKHWNLK